MTTEEKDFNAKVLEAVTLGVVSGAFCAHECYKKGEPVDEYFKQIEDLLKQYNELTKK
jgi:hypothetical protein